MTDQDLFDSLDMDESPSTNIDNPEKSSDTDKNQPVATKPAKQATAKKRASGKKSGKSSGSVTRQQKRVPMHQRQPLNVMGRDPNFEYRIVNDHPGRIDRFKLAGWVPDESTTVGDDVAGKASSMGSVTSAPVGKGSTGIVMKIPKELYAEDQATKQRMVDESEEAMLETTADAMDEAAGRRGEFQGEIKLGYAQSAKQ